MQIKNLAEIYEDQGNLNGDETEILKYTIKGGFISKVGDKLLLKYVIDVSTTDLYTDFVFNSESAIEISGFVSPGVTNEINIFIMKTPEGYKLTAYNIQGSPTSTYFEGSGIGTDDIDVYWRVQDISGSPASNTIIGKLASISLSKSS
jgi:hypothetical protein